MVAALRLSARSTSSRRQMFAWTSGETEPGSLHFFKEQGATVLPFCPRGFGGGEVGCVIGGAPLPPFMLPVFPLGKLIAMAFFCCKLTEPCLIPMLKAARLLAVSCNTTVLATATAVGWAGTVGVVAAGGKLVTGGSGVGGTRAIVVLLGRGEELEA